MATLDDIRHPMFRLKRGVRAIACIAMCSMALIACATIDFPTPQGFAKFTKDQRDYRAISADGVRIKARRIKNEPYGDLRMWQDAIGHYFESLGYKEKESGVLAATEGYSGRFGEYRAVFNGREHRYIAALFVGKGDIVIIEAAGEEAVFAKRRDAVMTSIRSFNPGK